MCVTVSHLFAVVSDRLEDGSQRVEGHGHVEEMGREEEVVQVAQARPREVPGDVQERLDRKYTMLYQIYSEGMTT